jgi:tetratricopeptide (TPR) repeat protein
LAGKNSPYCLLAFCIVAAIAAAGCSVEKNTASTRFYHGLTSHYNIYFNASESYKAGLAKVERGYRDDYAELLQVFEFSDPATVPMCQADMERAVMKASKLISLKSITSRPEVKKGSIPSEKEEEYLSRKEFNEWVDDAYLLMGKARLHKRELDLAESTLSYTVNSTPDINIKNEASVWLSRCLAEKGNLSESARILSETDGENSTDRKFRELYFITLTDLNLKQKKYGEAKASLEKILPQIKGKRNRYRYTYLLAQLSEKTGNSQDATALYRKIIKMNPPYEVEFSARINMAGVFDIETGNPGELSRELNRMLKDSKNEDYQDQIYFALARLAQREGKPEEAIEYYKKSAYVSRFNPNQKGKAYLALASYFYEKPDYLNSGSYYDSTIMFLEQKYPDYEAIRLKSQNLNLLVSQLNVVEREDSLRRVAKMPEAERTALIAGIIEKIKEGKGPDKQATDYSDRYNLGQFYENEMRFRGNIAQEGKWYFYNQTALTFGRTEFRRRWGDRKLEDNWRRVNRARLSGGPGMSDQAENQAQAKDTSMALTDIRKPEFYLRNLPLNDSLLKISDTKTGNALLEAGKIYSDKFSDKVKAVESFESVSKRYPGTDFDAEAIYNIYTVYRSTNDVRSEIYRQKLISSFPDNEFTRIISDPDYFRKKNEEAKESENLYKTAYEAFSNDSFEETVKLCDNGLSKFPKDPLAPKFQLLKAFALAKISDERKFKEELNILIKQWPSGEEAKRAAEIIAWLNQEIPQLKIEEDVQIAKEIYIEEPESQHVFVALIMNPSVNTNQANFDIISYNIDAYTNKNFKTQSAVVDNKFAMMTVSGFAKLSDALDYYNAFDAKRIIRNPSGATLHTFIIGKANLETFLKDKNPGRYIIFFNEKYLSPIKN